MTPDEETVEYLRSYPKPYITPAMAGKITGTDAQVIRMLARVEPWKLGYKVFVHGSRVKINKQSFIDCVFGGIGT
jgi:hypothetical protein